MKMMSIDDVPEGAVLAADLKAPNGNMILGHGAELSTGMIARLKKMGIKTVIIEITDSKELQIEREMMTSSINKRFLGTESNPFLQELKRIALEHVGST